MPGSSSASAAEPPQPPGSASVGVCGLGPLGTAVAARLVEVGFDVVVWTRSGRGVPGARTASSAAEAGATGLVLTLLATPDAVAAVAADVAGALLVQMSTVTPADVVALPGRVLDAPVLGSGAQAAAGALRILVGGEVADRARPVLDALGTTVHTGPVGSASAVKHVVNAAVAPMVALLAEALALADRLGLDRALVLDELELSRIGPLVSRKRGKIESGRFDPDVTLATFRKDLDLLARLGGGELRMVAAARELVAAALAEGHGGEDYSVLACG